MGLTGHHTICAECTSDC